MSFNSPINTGLPATPLTANKELSVDLIPIYNAIRNLAAYVDSLVNRRVITASENIALGQLCGIIDDAGTPKAALAQDGVLYAVGWCSQAGAVDESIEITLRGTYPILPASTLTAGEKQYLSATVPGAFSTTPSTQVIGFASSDTELVWHNMIPT